MRHFHLIGELTSKDVSRAVAGRAAEKSGVSPDILKKMLPMVAMMAMGGLGKQTRGAQGGGMQQMLGQMAMQQLMGGGAKSGGLGGLLGGLLGGGARKAQAQQQQTHQQGLKKLERPL